LSLSIDRERQQDISGIPLLTPAFGGKQTGKQKANGDVSNPGMGGNSGTDV